MRLNGYFIGRYVPGLVALAALFTLAFVFFAPQAGAQATPAASQPCEARPAPPPPLPETVQTIFLWNTKNLGYLTVYAGMLLSENKIPPGATSIQAGRLGTLEIQGSQIILGAPLLIDKRNIDKLDF